jgi:hypothetical protein
MSSTTQYKMCLLSAGRAKGQIAQTQTSSGLSDKDWSIILLHGMKIHQTCFIVNLPIMIVFNHYHGEHWLPPT